MFLLLQLDSVGGAKKTRSGNSPAPKTSLILTLSSALEINFY